MEPEYLQEEGIHLRRRRSWLTLGAVLVVVVGIVVSRLSTSTTDPRPAPVELPLGVSSPVSRAWPADLPDGTLFVAALGMVFTIDTSSGALTRTGVQTSATTTSMTRLAEGALVWGQGNGANQRVRADGRNAGPVRGELRRATSFLPGPEGLVWGTRRGRSDHSMWRLIDADGRVMQIVRVEGTAVSDGAGGLLDTDSHGFRPIFPSHEQPRQRGKVVATGPGGYVIRSCAQSGCRFTLHHNGDVTNTEQTIAMPQTTRRGELSPTNRFIATTGTAARSTLLISVVATGQGKDTFTMTRPRSDAVWLDDRWLALVSDDRLVLYNAADDQVITAALPLRSIGPLSWTPS